MPSLGNESKEPTGKLEIRVLAMPANINPNGDIFGGWVVSQMDLAGLSMARTFAKGRVTTVAINSMVFYAPVKIGDFICCYAEIIKIGRTSMHVKIEVWAIGGEDEARRQVTEGIFVYVAINDQGRPRAIISSSESE